MRLVEIAPEHHLVELSDGELATLRCAIDSPNPVIVAIRDMLRGLYAEREDVRRKQRDSRHLREYDSWIRAETDILRPRIELLEEILHNTAGNLAADEPGQPITEWLDDLLGKKE